MAISALRRPALPIGPASVPARLGALACLFWIALPIAPAAAAEGEVADFTDLSLEELYELEIVQVNVHGGHTHPAGQIMLGFDSTYMSMEGYKKNTSSVSETSLLEEFASVHTEMVMEMHMAQVMYAPSDRVTLMAMVPYMRGTMDHRHSDGGTFTTHAEGFGDVSVTGLFTVLGDVREGGGRLLLSGGLSFPTGSIDEKDTIEGQRKQLEYGMQTGSGTWDLLPGVTYLHDSEHWSWGLRGSARVRLGNNDEGYRFGNRYEFTGWAAYAATDWLAPHVRVEAGLEESLHGSDSRLNPRSNPESDPDHIGGRNLDLLLGLNLYVPQGVLGGNRLTLEGGVPLYQHLNGPQLAHDWRVTASWTLDF